MDKETALDKAGKVVGQVFLLSLGSFVVMTGIATLQGKLQPQYGAVSGLGGSGDGASFDECELVL